MNKKMTIGTRLLVLVVVLIIGCSYSVFGASEYPTKAIDMIVAYSAGGGTDIGARLLAASAERQLGQSIVVTNKPGAGGAIGFTALSKAKPDGYTIGVINIPSVLLIPMQTKTSYAVDDFEPIVLQVYDPGLLVVNKDSPLNTWEKFSQYAKANPGKIRMGNCGYATDIHVITLALEDEADIDVQPIPFDGTAEAVTAVIGNHVEATIAKVSEAKTGLENGQLIAIAALADERLPDYPDVPTLKEHGVDVKIASLRGIAVPRGTPAERVSVLHDAFKKAMEDPEYNEKMAKVGLQTHYMSGEDMKALIQEQIAVFKPIVESIQGTSK